VLERAGPTTVAPAYRMETRDLGVYGARRVPTMSGPGRALANNAAPGGARRRQAQKRRRDVFYGLAAGVGGSFVLGFLPGLSVMWWFGLLLGALLVGYVIVLVQIAATQAEPGLNRRPRLAMPQGEYDDNVRYLPVAAATVLHRSDAHPAYLLRRSAAN